MKEALLYIQRIKAIYPTGVFSKSDKILADFLLANPESIENATAASLAELTGVSPATIVRFCRKLGFAGLAEMKKSSDRLSYIEETSNDMDLSVNDDAQKVKEKVIAYNKMLLDQLESAMDPVKLKEIADQLVKARQIVIMGEGGSGTICRAAYDIFLKLALPCKLVEDIMFQTMEISMMSPDDLLFMIINSGRTSNMIINAKYAKECGIKTVGIVGAKNSPLANYLDAELNTCVFSSSYFSDISAARLCELTAISVLHSIIALASDPERLEKGEKIAASIDRKRTAVQD